MAGYLREPEAAFLTEPEQIVRASRLTVTELRGALAGENPPVVLDVRNPGEVAAGTVDQAMHIRLAQLPACLGEVPTGRAVVVYCQGGYRSSAAASLLHRGGHPDVSDLLGGYLAWQAAHQPVTA
ncbi:rhodanese-like domain-containing protein [Actinoplanes awajinensis]|uniref:rhodanese-like domain-containing protein n=1 Tax=Actinoplanes awajinensis TaxID=135946 RepID=UPI000AFD58D3|nr:rhodanese-like domain-containing protein [Actinoplanes awajinensis]